MPYIKVNLSNISKYSSTVQTIQNKVYRIQSEFSSIGSSLDWDIRSSSNIQRRITAISNELNSERSSLYKMGNYLSNAKSKYSQLDSENKMKNQSDVGLVVTRSASISIHSPRDYFDLKDFLLDSAKTSGQILTSIKSGFRIKEVGEYIHIFGKRKPRAKCGLPPGTRVKVGSDVYISNGYALWFKNAKLSDRFRSSFSGFGKDTFWLKNSAGKFNLGAAIGYAGIAYDTITNWVGNVKNGASTSKIAADATTDVAKGLGAMATAAAGAKTGAAIGAAIGSIFPGAGTVIGGFVGSLVGGAVAGFAYNYVVDGGIQIGGKSIAAWASTGLEKVYSTVGNAVKSGAKAVANVAKEAAKAVTNVAKSVGNAVQSAAKSVKNFFGKLFG